MTPVVSLVRVSLDSQTHLELRQAPQIQKEPGVLLFFPLQQSLCVKFVCYLMAEGRIRKKKKKVIKSPALLQRPPEADVRPKNNKDLMPRPSVKPPG